MFICILAIIMPNFPCKADDTDDIGSSWSAFIGVPTVLDALDHLGPTIFDGTTTNDQMSVIWQNHIVQFSFNGDPVLNTSIVYIDGHIETTGIAPGESSESFTSVLSLNTEGQLVVQTSDIPGRDAQRIIVNPENGSALLLSCTCIGKGTHQTQACTPAQCDLATHKCNTEDGAAKSLCLWWEID